MLSNVFRIIGHRFELNYAGLNTLANNAWGRNEKNPKKTRFRCQNAYANDEFSDLSKTLDMSRIWCERSFL